MSNPLEKFMQGQVSPDENLSQKKADMATERIHMENDETKKEINQKIANFISDNELYDVLGNLKESDQNIIVEELIKFKERKKIDTFNEEDMDKLKEEIKSKAETMAQNFKKDIAA